MAKLPLLCHFNHIIYVLPAAEIEVANAEISAARDFERVAESVVSRVLSKNSVSMLSKSSAYARRNTIAAGQLGSFGAAFFGRISSDSENDVEGKSRL